MIEYIFPSEATCAIFSFASSRKEFIHIGVDYVTKKIEKFGIQPKF